MLARLTEEQLREGVQLPLLNAGEDSAYHPERPLLRGSRNEELDSF